MKNPEEFNLQTIQHHHLLKMRAVKILRAARWEHDDIATVLHISAQTSQTYATGYEELQKRV